MANWVDLVSLLATLSLVGSTVYGILSIVRQYHKALESAKASLRSKGVDFSDHGISVTLSRRLEPEDCMHILIDMLRHNPQPLRSDAIARVEITDPVLRQHARSIRSSCVGRE
ncbi:hypothetical protein OBBRIDRAFT_796524 [Obba rivulosa]|uniref:Uncharacterized protein n=1 Tax=Obba rivulosa TaxID=1052685 RepID=A0A8E2AX92_9APHY|nr:hypothetical protein OBBRIDRAFT_796524 [Obba rivulosa]